MIKGVMGFVYPRMRSRMSDFMLGALVLCAMIGYSGTAYAFSPETVGFATRVNENVNSLRIFSAFVLPDESLSFEVIPTPKEHEYTLEAPEGAAVKMSPLRWSWRAPARTGLYPVKITQTDTGKMMTVNAFVMVPYDHMKNGHINGYNIGQYPNPRSSGYQLPRGFIEVTAETGEALVTPHFKLKQFLCKQSGTFPKYVVVRERLLQKLETTLAEVNKRGFRVEGFHIMSGYRTPAYNRSLGNVKFSRHLLGEAADILLEGKGKLATNRGAVLSAAALYRIIDQAHRESKDSSLIGGLAKYPSNHSHGQFVHVDVRGFMARWEG